MLNHKNSKFPFISGSLLLHSGPNHTFHSLPVLQGGLRAIRHYDHLHIFHLYNQYHDDVDGGTQVYRHEEEVASYIEGRGSFADENAMQFRGRSSSLY